MVTLLLTATAYADSLPPAAFRFLGEPTAAGRKHHRGVIADIFAPLVVLAAPCGLRSQKWAYSLEAYLNAVMTGPIKGSGEERPTTDEIRDWTAAFKYSKALAAKDFLEDRNEACDDVRNDDDLPDADKAVKIMNAPPSNPKDPWAGIIPVAPAKP